ncbi:MAG: hypothetical protein FJ011_27545 [Chloroflexi bacterium]|nr:hypothetical protein [Chloroflexota bacterium]
MVSSHKLNVLAESYADEAELEQVVSKLLEVVLGQYRTRLKRYDRELRDFESRFEMASPVFYQRFEAGELGDGADFFEWAGLYELRQNLAAKAQRMESAA